MRITADIIDEELILDNLTSDKAAQTDDKTINIKGDDDKGASRFPCVPNISTIFSKHMEITSKPQHEKITDMCNKFQKLNVSENCPYPTNRVLKMKEYAAMALHLKNKMDEKKHNSETNPKQGTPPAWLLPFFAKMKQEIKQEVMEELSKLPQIEMQGQSSGSGGKSDENQFYHGEVIHPGIFCDNCDQLIHGIRYKCGNCPDFDLCQECESLPNIHNKNHIFLKIRYPVSFRLYERQKLASIFVPNPAELFRNHSPKKLYEATFVRDETYPDGTILLPSCTFIKRWRVVNSGKRVWTHSTKLQHIQGSAGLTAQCDQVDVPHLKPGEEGVVSVVFKTPSVPGVYRSHWNFCHKSRPFGHIVWCHIVVSEKIPDPAPTENASESTVLPSSGPSSEKDQEVASIVEVLTAVKEEHKRGNVIPRKLAVNSHTATPNNTPFDLTPPKSPDHHAMNELKDVAEDKETTDSKDSADENDDEASVVSLSSSESDDAEFVVIPMPKCFSINETFAPHLNQFFKPEIDLKNTNLSEHKILKPQSIAVKPSFSSETVSQETGVPELSEHNEEQKETLVQESEQKISFSHNVSGDGSSSEISIIESGENSPTGPNVMPEVHQIHISVTEDMTPKLDNDNSSSCDGKEITVQVESSEEQPLDVPCSATFPKFPVEGITSIYEPAATSSTSQERTVQVLPEGLMFAPLNATAAIYKTAKSVFSTIHNQGTAYMRNNNDGGTASAASSSQLNAMDQLAEMGFCNRQHNEELLKKHKNDVALVVAELVSLNDNDWYASRHVPA